METDAFGFSDFARQLKREECGVTFVQMKDVRLDVQATKQAHAADSKQHLLHDARLAVAAVEMPCHKAVCLFILFDVCVEQVERDAPDINAPRLRFDIAATHQDFDVDGRALFIFDLLNRKHVWMSFTVVFFLPAVASQALTKISVAIEQPDSDERHTQIARGFQVIAREHPQPAGIERQRVVYAVLCAEVCDGIFARDLLFGVRFPGALVRHVSIETFGEPPHTLAIVRVTRHLHQAKLRDFRQQASRVVLALFPDRRIEVTKQRCSI